MAEAKTEALKLYRKSKKLNENSETFNIDFLCRTEYYTTPSDTQAERVL